MASIYDKASLVLIPSGTKTSKVYSQKPTNGDGDFTFSRSTAATRVNASGNIEKETQNLLNYSNNFGASYWLNNAGSCTRTGGQSGYDGTSDAWLLTQDGAGFDNILSNSTPVSGVYTFSVYAKANTGNTKFTLRATNTTSRSEFNLTTGTIVASAGIIDDEIVDVGGGWYRCSATFNASSDRFQIYPQWNSSSPESVYIQDAQLEQGLVARDYIETTTTAIYGGITDNVPRLDYTDSSCPALLLEPQRSNNISQSEYHQGAIAAVTRTYNTADTLSPEGYYNAVKYEVNANNSDPYLRVFNIPTSGNDATFSLYVKGASGQLFSMILGRDGYNELAYEAFTLDGTWQRLTLSKTFTTTPTTLTIGAEFSHSSDDGVLGQEYYLYGLQCEAGSYATSYIPTYGSAVTRNAETSYVTGATNLIGQTEGTIFAEFEIPQDFTSTEDHRFSISDGGIGNWIFVAINNIENVRMFVRTGNTSHIDVTDFNLITHGTTNKLALAYKSGSTSCYLNGIEILSSSSTFPAPTSPLSQLNLSGDSSAPTASPQVFGLNIKQRTQFPTRLSNEELATLTTI